MEHQAAATPPVPGATPAQVPAVPPITPAASPAPASGSQEPQPAVGVVTLTEAQYRNLLRDQARAKAMDKRNGIRPGSGTPMQPGDGDDPELVQRFNQSEAQRLDAEKRAMRAEVREKVRDLIEKPEYANIPKSTKDLILRNPASLSEAETLDEALIDIEQFLGEQAASVATLPGNPGSQPTPAAPGNQLPTRETPPTPGQGTPAPAAAAGLEDTSKLHGPAKTQAMIRNKVKESRGVKAV